MTVQGTPPPCAYCAAGDDAPAGKQWPADRFAHLYLCRGLSTYRIAELADVDRQRVTRQLRQAAVALRPRSAGLSGRLWA